jgi:hypothetical protein
MRAGTGRVQGVPDHRLGDQHSPLARHCWHVSSVSNSALAAPRSRRSTSSHLFGTRDVVPHEEGDGNWATIGPRKPLRVTKGLVDGEPACRRESAMCVSGVTPRDTEGADLYFRESLWWSACESREILSHD